MSVQVPLFEKMDPKSARPAPWVEDSEGGRFGVKEFVKSFGVLASAQGGISAIRQLVLELAIRGRFTSASSASSTSEPDPSKPFPLPNGWRWGRGEDVFNFVTSGSRGWAQYYAETGPIFLRIGNLDYETINLDLTSIQRVQPPANAEGIRTRVEPGDVLISITGDTGMVGLVPPDLGEAYINQHIALARPGPDVVPSFVARALTAPSLLGRLQRAQRGIKNSLGLEDVRKLVIPVPARSEQQDIVAKVDQLMALCDDLEARQAKKREVGTRLTKAALDALTTAEGPEEFEAAWKRVVENFATLVDDGAKVSDLRLAVVDLASRGRLTGRSPSATPSRDVLDVLRRERRRVGEERELARLRKAGKEPRDSKWKAGYAEQTFDLPEGLPLLPTGWVYAPIAVLGADPFCPVQTGPFGAQLHASEFVPTGVPVIAVGNLTGKGFTEEGLYFITEKKAEQLARYDVQAGDLLFARSGATLGKVCVAPPNVKNWRMTGHILRVRLDPRIIRTEIAAYWLWASAAVKAQVAATIRGGTRPGYNTSLLESIVLPVPPLEEQSLILAKIKHFMSVCDGLERMLVRAEQLASKLVEAVVQELVA